jgi:HEAT repeat protein
LLVALLLAACGEDEPAPATFGGKGVDAWAAALEGDGAEAAREELLQAGAEAVPVLAGLVARADAPQARLVALELVARIGPGAEEAVPALIEALEDDDPALRGFVATTLGRIGEGARPALLALDQHLHDRDAGVRVMSALAIWGIAGDARTAKDLLLRALRSENARLRSLAASAFSELGELAVDPLAVSLLDKDPRVREAAATALGHVGPAARKALPLLEQAVAIDSSEDVRLAARQAIDRITKG